MHTTHTREIQMDTVNKILKSYVFYIISSFGISLTIRANIGVSSYNSMNLAIATVSNMKVGTIATIINLLFLIAYMVLTRFKFKRKYIIQAISVMMFGYFINFFTYTVFGDLIVTSYASKLILISIGTTISGSSIGMIISYNAITFPIENVCMEVAEKTQFKFINLRYGIDVASVIISVLLSLTYSMPFFVREGTLISLIILTWAMNFVKNTHEKYLEKAAI